jgi:exosortase A-associated hydrolase 2
VPRLHAFHRGTDGGRRFCILHEPAPQHLAGAMVYVHPFAEEMNKSRRAVAVQSRALAAAGWWVLQVDLQGCGDSDGELADVRWNHWIDDVLDAARWLQQRCGQPAALWGLRLGALLAAHAAAAFEERADLLLWQPVQQGRQAIQQFLRQATARSLVGRAPGDSPRAPAPREQLAQHGALEVGGYLLSDALATAVEAAELRPPAHAARVAWLEVATLDGAALSPASVARVEAWRAAGCTVTAHAVPGLPFWQTQEIAEAPALVAATLAAVAGWAA